jgi:hypothetical protein
MEGAKSSSAAEKQSSATKGMPHLSKELILIGQCEVIALRTEDIVEARVDAFDVLPDGFGQDVILPVKLSASKQFKS